MQARGELAGERVAQLELLVNLVWREALRPPANAGLVARLDAA